MTATYERSFDMLPSPAVTDPSDSGFRYAEALSEAYGSFMAIPDCPDVVFAELGVVDVFAVAHCSMDKFVCRIIDGGRPSQVPSAYAAEMPIAALVRGFVFWCWRLSVNVPSYFSMHKRTQTTEVHHAVPGPVLGIRPYQAFIRFFSGNSLLEKGHRKAIERAALSWVAMAQIPFIVHKAVVLAGRGSLAVIYGALHRFRPTVGTNRIMGH